MKLSDFQALTFDCYGTLIDWESGMIRGLEPLVRRAPAGLTRNAILEAHAHHESSQQMWTPTMAYSDILATTYKRLAEAWGLTASWDECRAYGRSVKDWQPFPDSVEALAYLKQHFKLVVLSNVDNASFAHSNEKLQVRFDAVYTAQDIGSYKPDTRNFEYMMEKLQGIGVDRSGILHTAESLFHDHVPANRLGLTSCWIYRRHGQEGYGATANPGVMPACAFRFNSLADMAVAHRHEQSA